MNAKNEKERVAGSREVIAYCLSIRVQPIILIHQNRRN